ncbi:HupE/UreJ family protein [Methylobacter tundripaludum]|uniref:HupE/UreJ protein n=1 Tax=Methylobacter tundripaludum (strain ATCC BAA-1195 / DSM 17260 / SV96) TaxID=697282 RepID=G3J1B3_METTV|nr:HupE/UreJ family protein [Methylobacter tundripaludum]EGW20985.1 HupE/UreJ protein [Methylobacter tundripaludum SV96]
MKKIIVVAGLIAFSQAALAHTGLLPTDGFGHGFQHPFLGLDHFLVMLGLGLWASSQSRLLAQQAIGVFLLFMTAGALLGLAGIGFAYVETAILVSLLFVGMALSFGMTSIVPTLRRGNSVCNAPALRWDAGASDTAFPFMPQRVRRSVGTIIILTSIAAFAAMHGLAHGSEMPLDASAYAYTAGIISGTAVLHCSGLALGLIARRINAAGLLRVYGTLTGVIGAWLLFAA